jgi:hypothetical protein
LINFEGRYLEQRREIVWLEGLCNVSYVVMAIISSLCVLAGVVMVNCVVPGWTVVLILYVL